MYFGNSCEIFLEIVKNTKLTVTIPYFLNNTWRIHKYLKLKKEPGKEALKVISIKAIDINRVTPE